MHYKACCTAAILVACCICFPAELRSEIDSDRLLQSPVSSDDSKLESAESDPEGRSSNARSTLLQQRSVGKSSTQQLGRQLFDLDVQNRRAPRLTGELQASGRCRSAPCREELQAQVIEGTSKRRFANVRSVSPIAEDGEHVVLDIQWQRIPRTAGEAGSSRIKAYKVFLIDQTQRSYELWRVTDKAPGIGSPRPSGAVWEVDNSGPRASYRLVEPDQRFEPKLPISRSIQVRVQKDSNLEVVVVAELDGQRAEEAAGSDMTGREDVLSETVRSSTPQTVAELQIRDPALLTCIEDSYTGGTPISSVTELFCGSYGIESLSGLGELTYLQVLSLADNPIVSLFPISSLYGLQSLNISDTQVADINPLGLLNQLVSFYADNTSIVDLSPLVQSSTVEHVSVSGAGIHTIPPLSQTQLSFLNLANNPISDLSGLAGAYELTELNLSIDLDSSMQDPLVFGSLAMILDLTANSESALETVWLDHHPNLPCFHLNQLEQNLNALGNGGALHRPSECSSITIPSNVGTTPQPSAGLDFTVLWEVEDAIQGSFYQLSEHGLETGHKLIHHSESSSFWFGDLTVEDDRLGLTRLMVRHCHVASNECSAWSDPAGHAILGSGTEVATDALTAISDDSLRACIQNEIDNLQAAEQDEMGSVVYSGQLTKLNCVSEEIKKLNGIASFPNLNTFHLSGNSIESLAPLVPILMADPTLVLNDRAIWLANNKLSASAISALSFVDSPLGILDLSYNGIESLDALASIPRINTLRVTQNNISTLDNLSQATFQEISAEDNDIQSFPSLSEVRNLRLSSNSIDSVPNGTQLPDELIQLSISSNPIGQSGDAALNQLFSTGQSLETLTIDHAELTSVGFLHQVPALTTLSARSNHISQVPATGTNHGLEQLLLSRNPLSDLGVTAELPALEELDLTETELSAFPQLPMTPALRSLKVSGGDFSDESSLDALANALQLERAWFGGNSLRDVSALIQLAQSPGTVLGDHGGEEPLDLNLEIGIECIQLLELEALGVLYVNSELAQNRCRGAVEYLEASLAEDLLTYTVNWSVPIAPDSYSTVGYYEVLASDGSNTFSEQVSAGPASTQFSLELPSAGAWGFQVRACVEEGLCGRWSPNVSSTYPLFKVDAVQVSPESLYLEWSYESATNPTTLNRLKFEVAPLFPVIDPVFIEWGSGGDWTLPLALFEDWPGKIVRVRLCEDLDGEFRCGDSSEIRLAPNSVDPNIASPSNVQLIQKSIELSEYHLSWEHPSAADMLFYQIEEFHVEADGSVGPSSRRFTVETNRMDLKRFAPGNHLRYSVAACVKNESDNAICSEPVFSSGDVDANHIFHPSFGEIGPVSGACWFDPTNILYQTIGETEWMSARVRVRWEYEPLESMVPRGFEVRRPHRAEGGPHSHQVYTTNDYNSISFLDGGGVVWALDHPPPYTTGTVTVAGAAGLGQNDEIKINAYLRGVAGSPYLRSEEVAFEPIIQDDDGSPILNEETRCEGELVEQTPRGEIQAGGPGDLMPGHWAMPLGNNQAFRFFWTSRLIEDEDSAGTFGLSYDLIALWHTYMRIGDQYSPIWYYSRMKLTDESQGQFIEGKIIRPRQNEERDLDVGTMRIYFEHLGHPGSFDDNRRAWVSLHIYDEFGLNGERDFPIDDFLLSGSIWDPDAFSTPNPSDHFRGIWVEAGEGPLFDEEEKMLANSDFLISEWIIGAMNSLGVYTFDDAGRPIWFMNWDCDGEFADGDCVFTNMPDFGGTWSTTNLLSVINNASGLYEPPGTSQGVEVVWFEDAEFRRSFEEGVGAPNEDLRAGSFCIDLQGQLGTREFDIRRGGIGSSLDCSLNSHRTADLRKIANLHGIEFEIVGQMESEEEARCDVLGEASDRCELLLSWFTDDYFPNAQPMFSRAGDPTLTHVNELCIEDSGTHFDFAVGGLQCNILEAGISGSDIFRFHLVNRPNSEGNFEEDQSSIIATSRELRIFAESFGEPSQPPAPDPVGQQPDPFSDFPYQVFQESQTVGATRGEFRVTESGAAEYSIGILTVPGSGGMAPNVALQYNSQNSNGPFGIGFNLAGMSQIGRCGQTLIQDGVSTGVTLTEDDQFCLDGQRLMPLGEQLAGFPSVCDGQVEYRLEIDDMTRVVACGSMNGAPTHFEVSRRDGTTATYGWDPAGQDGVDQSSQIIAPLQQTIYAWPVSRIKDSSRNYISFLYKQPGKLGDATSAPWIEWLPEAILYTGNLNTQDAPFTSIEFEPGSFEETEIQFDGYMAGNKVRLTTRIDHILVHGHPGSDHSHSGPIRSYELAYETDPQGFNLLSSVTECHSAGLASCFAPTSFNWITGTPAAWFHPDHSFEVAVIADFRGAQAADLSANGRQEFVAMKKGDDNRAAFQVFVSSINEDNGLDFNDAPIILFGACEVAHDKIGAWSFADVQGIGTHGLIYAVRTCGESLQGPGIYYHKWNPSLNALEVSPTKIGEIPAGHLGSSDLVLNVTPADVDGDGLVDFIVTLGSEDESALNTAPRSAWLYRNLSTDTEVNLSNPIEIEGLSEQLLDPVPDLSQICQYFYSLNISRSNVFTVDHSGRVAMIATSSRSEICEDPGGGLLETLKALGPVISASEFEEFKLMYPDHPFGDDGFVSNTGAYYIEVGDDGTASAVLSSSLPSGSGRRFIPIDYNNDGYSDFITLAKSEDSGSRTIVELYINDGDSISESPLKSFEVDIKFEYSHYMIFTDMTGNQLPDLLVPYYMSNPGARHPYRSHRWPWVVANGDGGFVLDDDLFSQSPSLPIQKEYGHQLLYADITGNGRQDAINFGGWETPEGWVRVEVHENFLIPTGGDSLSTRYRQARLLERITDGFGASTELVYKPLSHDSVHSEDSLDTDIPSDYPVYDVKVPKFIVSEVSSSSPGYSDAAGTSPVYQADSRALVKYHYEGAKIQAGGRGFLGFSIVSSYDAQSGVLTRTRYHQDFPFIGQARGTRSWYLTDDPWPANGGKPSFPGWSDGSCQIGATWTDIMLGCSESIWASFSAGDHLHTPYLSESWEWSAVPNYSSGVLSGSSFTHLTITTIDNLDSFGNPGNIEVSVYDNLSGSGVPFSKVTTENLFADDLAVSQGLWFLGRLERSKVTHERIGQAPEVRSSCFRYDFEGSSRPPTGALRLEVVEPSTASGCSAGALVTEYQFDDYGNQTATTVLINGQQERKSGTEFDASGAIAVADQLYLGSSAHDVSVIVSWDPYGNPLETKNAQGVRAWHYYDSAGRLHYSRIEDGSWSRTWYISSPQGANPDDPSELYMDLCPHPQDTSLVEISRVAGGGETAACKDRLGRTVRSLQRAFDGSWIVTDRRLDSVSRVLQTSEPYFYGGSPHWTRFTYDEIGRVEFVERPDGTQEHWTYGQFTKTHTLSEGNSTLRSAQLTKNLLGEKVQEHRHPDGGTSSFEYDALGQLRRVRGPMFHSSSTTVDDTIEIWYDALGFRERINDPDKGEWHYRYNALGELVCQIDSLGNGVLTDYDEVGRPTERWDLVDLVPGDISNCEHFNGTTHAVGHSAWVYGRDSNLSSFNQLLSESAETYESPGESKQKLYQYDSLGRVKVTTTEIYDGIATHDYEERVTYDHFGRVFQAFDASSQFTSTESNAGGYGQQFAYNEYGYLREIKEAGSTSQTTIYLEIEGMDARGNVSKAIKGNGMEMLADHDEITGALLAKLEYSGGLIQNTAVALTLGWDAYGRLQNLNDLTAVNPGHFEFFTYDGQDRLIDVHYSQNGSGDPLQWAVRQSMAYDASGAGNMIYKSDVGDYVYDTDRPHAALSAGGLSFEYNDAGHMTKDYQGGIQRRTLQYTSFGKVSAVSRHNQASMTQFRYGANRARFLRVDVEPGSLTRTHYVGSVEVIRSDGGNCPVEFRRDIGGIAQRHHCSGSQMVRTRYVHKDHLGSVTAISDEFGIVIARMNFDAWGNRRDALDQANWIDWVSTSPQFVEQMLAFTPRGFTGHEHVDGHGLIHMNGRIYDPHIARFLQADPFVEDTATLNRYTYVHNSPLVYTDPSGYMSLKSFVRTAAAVFVSVYTGGVASGQWGLFAGSSVSTATAIATVSIGGAVSGAIMTGSFEGAAWGAFSAQAFYHFGQAFGNQAGVRGNLAGGMSAEGLAAKSIGHGLIGGVLSHLQGGRFGHGFLSSGVTGAASPAISTSFNGNVMAQGAFAALVGGSVSSASGGKFANGAVTAAMAYAFNHCQTTRCFGSGDNEIHPSQYELGLEISVSPTELIKARGGRMGKMLDVMGADLTVSSDGYATIGIRHPSQAGVELRYDGQGSFRLTGPGGAMDLQRSDLDMMFGVDMPLGVGWSAGTTAQFDPKVTLNGNLLVVSGKGTITTRLTPQQRSNLFDRDWWHTNLTGGVPRSHGPGGN